jgi:UV DNA damage endonuclease
MSLPRQLRLGLCCLFREEPIRFRTATATALLRRPWQEQLQKLSTLCLENADHLLLALQACVRLEIGAFRILSPFLPLYTHPQAGYRLDDLPEAAEIRRRLALVAAFRADHGLRLSFHPDQFILLNSPRPEVVAASIAELDYQAMLAEQVGAEVINLHLGGAYGDKPAAIARFLAVWPRLSAAVRSRLSIENDDRSYAPADLLPVAERLPVPVVYDVHHHRCLPDALDIAEATGRCAATWRRLGREPYFHLSSPRGGWDSGDLRPHADVIDPADFPAAWRDLDFPFTVDVEAKAKELAVVALRQALSVPGGGQKIRKNKAIAPGQASSGMASASQRT